jgi:hypothetical protein
MPAHIEVFTVCDAASIKQGSLSLLNTYNTVRADDPICTHEFVVAMSVGFEVDDAGEHEILIEMVDSDARSLKYFRTKFSFPVPATIAPVCRSVWRFEYGFSSHGDYGFRLSCDGKQLGEITVYFLPASPES